jgi:hypothetical protein
MSDTRLTLAQHDSEWLLQRERVLNDYQLQKARRDTRARGRHRNPAMYLGLPDPDPTDQTKAARAVQKLADRLGAGPEAVDEVLAMLGLTAPASVPEKTASRRHGTCPTCQQAGIPLRVNGELTVHPDPAQNRCDGSNTRPARKAAA